MKMVISEHLNGAGMPMPNTPNGKTSNSIRSITVDKTHIQWPKGDKQQYN